LDFQCLGRNCDDATLMNVHYVACRKERVERLVEVASTAHFTAEVIDVDYYALQRALKLIENQLPMKKDEATTAVVNLEETSSLLVVIRGDQIIYTRSQSFHNPMSSLETKHYRGIDTRVLDSIICAQITQTLQFYTACGHSPLEQIVLCGECSVIPQLAASVEFQQHIPVIVGNPFYNADFSSEVDAALLQATAPAFMLCSGLAMRKVTHELH
jgi:type IV pilus assembly protein PilM